MPLPILLTGLGAITPAGRDVASCWDALLAGRPALAPLTRFPLGGIACEIGGQIDPLPPEASATDSATALALHAAREALADAPAEGLAVITGSNFGALAEGADAMAGLLPPEHLRACNHAVVAERLAAALGAAGPVASISLSCASGASALALAADWLRAGRATRVLAVGVDSLSLCAWSGLCSLRTMARDGVIRPFDAARGGTIFSEGACAILLETAPTRPALAELRGWATGNNGFHLTAPPPRGAGSLRVMRDALSAAGLPPSGLGFLAAHATATKGGDLAEAQAVADLLSDSAATVPVAAFKAAAGHLLGASGIFEAAMAAEALRRNAVPPIAHAPAPEPGLPDLDLVTGAPRPPAAPTALTNSAGFGGCNASLVLAVGGPPSVAAAAGRKEVQPPRPLPLALTGAGFLSALGIGMEEAAAAWEEGESACFPASRIPAPDGVADDTAGEVPDFDPDALLPSAKAYLDRQSLLLLSAAALARQQGEAAGALPGGERAGVFTGTSWGAAETLERFYADCLAKGPRLVKPMLFPHTYANAAASLLAMEWGLSGSHMNFAGGANASSLALVAAADALRAGACDVAYAGGSEALSALRWCAEAARRPLATPLGEAGAVFLLEREADALARGTTPLALLAGTGLARSGDEAVRLALAEAGLAPDAFTALYTAPGIPRPAGLPASLPLRVPETLTGYCDGASGAVLLACALLDLPSANGPALLLTRDETGTAVALVLAPSRA